MSLSGNSGRPVKLKVPAEYKFHKLYAVNKPLDEIIDLSASVSDQVGLPRAVPELTPVYPSVPSTSTRTESSIINVSRDVVVDNVAVPPDVRHDPPSGDVEEREAIIVLLLAKYGVMSCNLSNSLDPTTPGIIFSVASAVIASTTLNSSVLFSFATGLQRNARLVTSIVKMSDIEKFSMSLGNIEAPSSLFMSRRLSITCERVDTPVILGSSIASECDVR